MYRLLIIDDEETVVDRLAFGIDWESIGISDVYKAYNVQMALDLLERMRIDVIVTDIKMPKGTGLDIAKKVAEMWKHSKVILLSGYEDFNYAQDAIEYGVIKYLIKPATHSEIIEAVKLAIDKIEEELSKATQYDRARNRLKASAPIIAGRYMHDWIIKNGLPPSGDDLLFLKEYTKFEMNKGASLIIVHPDRWLEAGNTAEKAGVFDVMLLELAQDNLVSNTNLIMFRDEIDNYVFVSQHEQGDHTSAVHYIMEMVQTFQLAMKHSLNCIASVYFDKPTDPDDLPASYKRILHTIYAQPKLHAGVIMGPGNIIVDDEDEDEAFSISNKYQSLPTTIHALQKEKALAEIESLFNELLEADTLSYASLLDVYLLVASSIMRSAHERNIPVTKWIDEGESQILYRFSSVNELHQWCTHSIAKFIDYCMQSDNNHRIVIEAKRIIDESLSGEISLSEIADKLYIHPNYLSVLFKRESGCTFMSYITNKRIDLAKRYLLEYGAKVYEVAERVGYSSVAHFTRTFKRVTGVSPKEYQTQQ